jgi:hypothetical protein
MAQVFISHSARDEAYKSFFNKGFATSVVNAKYEEIEQLLKGAITTEQIKADIVQSSAVFVLLSRNVQMLEHTRDWVTFEVGYAAGASGGKRDIWVFENIQDTGQITIALPAFDHYVVYDTSDGALVYLKQIIESYNDMRVLGHIAAGSAGGAFVSQDRGTGAVIGGIVGLVYSKLSTSRPPGIQIICPNPTCRLNYRIHLPEQMPQFRCAKCNSWWMNPLARS